MKASGSAASKIILSGEHFVVYQCPALALPVPNLRFSVTLDDERPPVATDDLILQGLDICKNHWGGPGRDLAVDINSQIPTAAGMGSSAALSVALVRAYSQLVGQSLTPQQTVDLSMELESIAHGRPSGIDSNVVTYERSLYFIPNSAPEFLSPSGDLGVAVLHSNLPSRTREMVEKVRQFSREHPDDFGTILNQAQSLVPQFRQALEAGEVRHLAELATENHHLLRKIGVTIPETEDLVEVALKCGAWGAKMSGGGGGGVVLAFTSPDELPSVVEKLVQSGHSPLAHFTI